MTLVRSWSEWCQKNVFVVFVFSLECVLFQGVYGNPGVAQVLINVCLSLQISQGHSLENKRQVTTPPPKGWNGRGPRRAELPNLLEINFSTKL